jgi:putative ABC transport system permease protein
MHDLKHALRLFMKSTGFTAVVVITLAIGIGANVAVFSIIQGTLLRPLPYKDPDRLITILDTSKHERELAKIFASYEDFEDFSRHSQTLESVAAETWAARPSAVLTGRGPAKAYLTIPVTAGFFNTLGVGAKLGRTFRPGDLTGGCAVVLSDKFWRARLGADSRIVGQALSLDDRACTVTGVMPATLAVYPPETQIWTLILPNDPRLKNHFGVFMIARLKMGASIARTRAELTALHNNRHAHDFNGEKDFTPLVDGLQEQFTWLASRTLRSTLAVVFAAVVVVLFMACLNVAGLLTGRAFARGREFATRAALGLGAAGLVRQMLIESAMLSSAGAALGVLVAYAATRYFGAAQPIELPVGSSISINVPTLAFTVGVSMVSTVIFAVVPAWAISRGDSYAALRVTAGNMAPGRQRMARILVGAQMALSVILLAAAGLLIQSVLRFQSADIGFARAHIWASNGSLPAGYDDQPARRIRFYEELQQKLASLPGVTSATVASTLPPYGLGLGTVEVEGKPVSRETQLHDVGEAAVGPDYFRLFQVGLRHGRTFTKGDQGSSEHVAIVNEAFAREYFGVQDPMGRKIRIGDEHEWLTVTGVVANEKRPTVYEEMKWSTLPAVYRPVAQRPPAAFAIAVRTAMQRTGLPHEIEKAVESVDRKAALGDIEPMETRLAPYLKYPRFRAVLFATFSLMAIALAAIGLYGLLAQFVAQRTVEVGLRKAVGARGVDIVDLIARKGGGPALAGVFAGFALSFMLTRYLESLVYEVTPTDPATLAAAPVVMLTVGVFAMIVPLRRALRLDPTMALRSE